MAIGINHVTICVQNKGIAEDFYMTKLGWEKVVKGQSLWVKIGDQFIHIHEDQDKMANNDSRHFAIEVDDLIKYLAEIVSRGVPIFDIDANNEPIIINCNLNKPNRNYFTKDPFGYLIEFIDSNNPFFK